MAPRGGVRAKVEQPGNTDYQNHHMTEIFEKGLSFSGFERDGLYLSRGDGTYLEISGVSGLDSIGDGRGCSFADLDNDGDLDVVVVPVQNEAGVFIGTTWAKKTALYE